MLLVAGHDYTTLPELLEESTAQLVVYPAGDPMLIPNSHAILVQRMAFSEMVEMKTKLPVEATIQGIPVYWSLAVIEGAPRLFVWPSPDKNMFARFCYCPAMREI